MLIGYMRVSKSDGSQNLDLQRDALLAVGVQEEHIYQDLASGKEDDRPGLQNCLKALRKNCHFQKCSARISEVYFTIGA